jgi:hypothetical protein
MMRTNGPEELHARMCKYAKQMRKFKECTNPTPHVLTTRVVTQPCASPNAKIYKRGPTRPP